MELIIIISTFLVAAIIGLLTKRRGLIEGTAILAGAIALTETIVIVMKIAAGQNYQIGGIFGIDSLGALIILIVAILNFATSLYAKEYLRRETAKNIIGVNRPRQFFILLNLFSMAMYLAVSAQNPILAWISIEATTLSTAFLISFYNKPSAMEAAWKYLIINSVGLLLGFFGTMLFFVSLLHVQEAGWATWQNILENAGKIDPFIAKIAFIFVLIGYGTKVGLAPMHTWKPDAYGKAPSPIGAMFSGALLPVAFYIILKFRVITDSIVGPSFTGNLLIAFGLVSIIFPAFIIMVVKDYKRLLAYSSIENAGVIALGFGFGGLGILAAILHLIYHSIIKAALFFLSGNLMLKYNSAKIENIKGAIKVLPWTSSLFLIGFFAITGAPPFGVFLTKLLIFSAGFYTHPKLSAFALFLIAVLFIGFFRQAMAMFFSKKSAEAVPEKENFRLLGPALSLLALVLILSFYQPAFLQILINNAAAIY